MNRILLIISFLFLLGCVKDEPIGIFNLSEEASKYKIDGEITSFKMIDNNGITDLFRQENFSLYHHEPWEGGFFESYDIAYRSIINNYYFNLRLNADDYSSTMSFTWNQNNYVYYDFKYKETDSDGFKPVISFYKSMMIRGVNYKDIIELDYSKGVDKIQDNTPLKAFISGKKGLLKIVRKDGIVLERLS